MATNFHVSTFDLFENILPVQHHYYMPKEVDRGLGVVDGHLWATIPGQNILLLLVSQLVGADLFHPGIRECSVSPFKTGTASYS